MTISGNLFDANTEDLETTVGTWVASTNAAVARSSTVGGYSGSNALRLTASAGGYYLGATGLTTGVTAATDYTCSFRAKAGSTTRDVSLKVNWYTSANGFISQGIFNGGTNVTSAAWVSVSGTLTSPALAAKAEVFWGPDAGGAAETFYGDYFCLRTSATIPALAQTVTASSLALTATKGSARVLQTTLQRIYALAKSLTVTKGSAQVIPDPYTIAAAAYQPTVTYPGASVTRVPEMQDRDLTVAAAYPGLLEIGVAYPAGLDVEARYPEEP